MNKRRTCITPSSNYLIGLIENTENVTKCTPRFESFTLASSGNVSRETIVIGVFPESELNISELKIVNTLMITFIIYFSHSL